jgi:hypothetical protein
VVTSEGGVQLQNGRSNFHRSMLQPALSGGKIMEVFVRCVDRHVSQGYDTNYVI